MITDVFAFFVSFSSNQILDICFWCIFIRARYYYRAARSVRDLRDPRSPRPEEGHEAPRALPAAEEAPLAAPRFPRGLPQATGVPGNPRRSVDDGDDEEWRAGQQGARLLGLDVMVSKN